MPLLFKLCERSFEFGSARFEAKTAWCWYFVTKLWSFYILSCHNLYLATPIYCVYDVMHIGLILVLVIREISTFSCSRTYLRLSQRWDQMWASIQITLQVIFFISRQVLMFNPIVSNHLWISWKPQFDPPTTRPSWLWQSIKALEWSFLSVFDRLLKKIFKNPMHFSLFTVVGACWSLQTQQVDHRPFW